jgi:hypothetical protein
MSPIPDDINVRPRQHYAVIDEVRIHHSKPYYLLVWTSQ